MLIICIKLFNTINKVQCKKCGWEIGIKQKYGTFSSGEVEACPNCTDGIRHSTVTSRERESGDNYLVGRFDFFKINGRPYPSVFDVKKIP